MSSESCAHVAYLHPQQTPDSATSLLLFGICNLLSVGCHKRTSLRFSDKPISPPFCLFVSSQFVMLPRRAAAKLIARVPKSFHVSSFMVIIFVYRRKEHWTTVGVAAYEQQTLKNEIHSFIRSFGHFYSATSSPLLLRGAPDYSMDTVSEFQAEAHRQL